MIKALSIIGIALTAILIVVTVYYAESATSARHEYWNNYDYSYDDYDYGSYDYDYDSDYDYNQRQKLTLEAGLVTQLFFLFFTTISILWITKVKRVVAKVFGIISLVLSGIMVLADLFLITFPDADFDDCAPFWILYALHMIPFTIIGLVQVVKYNRTLKFGYVDPVPIRHESIDNTPSMGRNTSTASEEENKRTPQPGPDPKLIDTDPVITDEDDYDEDIESIEDL